MIDALSNYCTEVSKDVATATFARVDEEAFSKNLGCQEFELLFCRRITGSMILKIEFSDSTFFPPEIMRISFEAMI
jgi:hypothetical protein